MVASGNDFVIVENLAGNLSQFAKRICQRKTGIGADGLSVLEKTKHADIRMRVFNPDGSEAAMCGNGARCVAVYLSEIKKIKSKKFSIETKAGEILAQVNKNNARIKMSHPQDIKLDIPISVNYRDIKVSFIDTGVPHVCVFVQGLERIDVAGIGRQIRFHKNFAPRGANVNFIEQVDKDFIKVRTYERGVESETLACGTGSVASSIIAFLKGKGAKVAKVKERKFLIKVLTLSTDILKIYFDFKNGRISDVWLEGPARIVYKGEYYYV
ncbi:MAG: diaminopimelate epimerase [Candidatus Omnitrophota bacterium]|nr:diaminopimelate epimerase [Candidatus Omnitrophota bacterium]